MAADTTQPFTHVAFLRGMNVGGHRLTNEDLCAIFLDMGFARALPYQASGNVLLAASDGVNPSTIEAVLQSRLGYAVPTMVRTADEVRTIAEKTPFTDQELMATDGKVQVILLTDSAQGVDVTSGQPREDRFINDGTELYWLPVQGIGTSEVDHKALTRVVGTMTIRTQGTMQRIAKNLQ